jgi:hypothetical protein
MAFQSDHVKNKYPLFYKLSNYFREKRMKYFLNYTKLNEKDRILDVGGGYYFWDTVSIKNSITLLNIEEIKGQGDSRISIVYYDGRKFPFLDKEFDIVFSNSTIEHVGDFWDQKLFAQEIVRVGKKYFIQVPSFWFFYEPHAFFPLFQFLPPVIKIFIRKIYKKPTYPIEELLSIRLLTKAELKILFPNGKVKTERFLIFPKSYYVMG